MAKIKAIILDCDGVILDSNEAYEKMYEDLFNKYGVRKTSKEIYPHFGESAKHIMKVFFHKKKNISVIYRDYKKLISDEKFQRSIKIHRGSKTSIKNLSKDYKLVVVSGALRFRLLNSLGRYDLLRYLKFVIGSDDVRNAKPNPEALNKAIRRLHVKRNEVVFVGDAPNDLRSAKRAKIKFVAVLTGVFDRKTAKQMKADYIISDINKVRQLVKKIERSK